MLHAGPRWVGRRRSLEGQGMAGQAVIQSLSPPCSSIIASRLPQVPGGSRHPQRRGRLLQGRLSLMIADNISKLLNNPDAVQ